MKCIVNNPQNEFSTQPPTPMHLVWLNSRHTWRWPHRGPKHVVLYYTKIDKYLLCWLKYSVLHVNTLLYTTQRGWHTSRQQLLNHSGHACCYAILNHLKHHCCALQFVTDDVASGIRGILSKFPSSRYLFRLVPTLLTCSACEILLIAKLLPV